MKKKILALSLALTLALTGCGGTAVIRPQGPKESDAPVIQELPEELKGNMERQSMTLLSLESQAHPGENVILSPLSIQIALAMAANGAEGEAREDLEALFGVTTEEMGELFRLLAAREDGVLSMANSLWVNEGVGDAVSGEFRDTLAGTYKAKEGTFKPLNEASAGEINGWVSEKTHGRIDSIVSPAALEPDLLALLLNAVYFDGKWRAPFEKEDTVPGPFQALQGEQEAQLMSDWVGTYFENDQATGFAKSYEGGYEFVAILPKEEGAPRLEELDLESFLASRTGAYDVDIKVPKFELRYETSLVKSLADMGLGSLFQGGSMDAMLTREARQEGLSAYVSDVVHKTYMRMYEEGTEAAAVTGVMVAPTSAEMAPPEIKQVWLDRPFAFLILDQTYGQIVFCGSILSVE